MVEDNQIIQEVKLQNNLIGKCKVCNKDKKIYSRNTCKSCYNRIHRDQIKQKDCITRWRNKHPDYYKDYYLKNKGESNEVLREETIV